MGEVFGSRGWIPHECLDAVLLVGSEFSLLQDRIRSVGNGFVPSRGDCYEPRCPLRVASLQVSASPLTFTAML